MSDFQDLIIQRLEGRISAGAMSAAAVRVEQRGGYGSAVPSGAFGHTGATGTIAWAEAQIRSCGRCADEWFAIGGRINAKGVRKYRCRCAL